MTIPMDHDASAAMPRRRFGPALEPGGVRFRLWAPSVDAADLVLPGRTRIPMRMVGGGWFEARADDVGPGQRYRFAAGDLLFPDPASRAQADDANGWSLLVPPMPPSSPRAVRPWKEAIIAEVHVGSATPEGSFRALAGRLGHFAEAGYTAIELMPIGDFPGANNWGYDAVLPFAPEAGYGTPRDLRDLVDHAHGLGLAMLVDVVCNHFGPLDNYLPHYARDFFEPGEETPWGTAVNLARPEVRAFFCENAAMWLRDYDFDGIRFDAVHEFRTADAGRFKRELAAAARAAKADAMLVMENFDYELDLVARRDGAAPLYDAMWNDDIHHALHVLVTEDSHGYYRSFAEAPVGRARKALASGAGADPAGRDASAVPPDAFVSFIQNHDHIGNRPEGRRLSSDLDAERLDFLHFVIMLSPQIPLFFMGEEMHLRQPFPFFGDLKGELADLVREGRMRETAALLGSAAGGGSPVDPTAQSTAAMAKLDWDEFARPERRQALERFRELVRLRRRWIWPLGRSRYLGSSSVEEGDCLAVSWRYGGGTLVLAMNPTPEEGRLAIAPRPPFATTGEAARGPGGLSFRAWSAAAWIERPQSRPAEAWRRPRLTGIAPGSSGGRGARAR